MATVCIDMIDSTSAGRRTAAAGKDFGPLTDTPPSDGAQPNPTGAPPTRTGWDVARAIGRPYDCDPATAAACLAHLAQFDTSGTEGMFGPAVPIADGTPGLDRVIALSGRDPAWRAP